ncbi:hypothetical protein K7887_22380 (plasmid) [Sutcliffiella horikoshii]|uniref:YobI family P-loop NTPase n=1 Tax=Sutcliffiella horikoshii TaxID=79883 RepID=UPI001CBC6747|nr:P-loop NTPase fold protein [Sutcliffiella horikoshii]UAL49867.1 hypothetical protein K7887_22380 [Sutcliffiella horikoshii]
MKKWIIQALTKLTTGLTKLQTKLASDENKPKSLFEDLTPSTDIDKNGKYAEAISWGLENDKVHNIALTGPYGSGKSSVLKTYEEKYRDKYHFLNISLATFRPKEGQTGEKELEKSILQQMIYRVRNRTIPFSRFKRIKHVKNSSIILYLTLLLVSVIASIYLFQPTYLMDIYNGTLLQQNFSSREPLKILWAFLLIAVTLLFPFFFLKEIYNIIRGNLNFNKVSIANATIEKSNVEAESIFDKYLDEILYFFEATKYDVVIFEDLDRFNNLNIFESLRELNGLINSSEQIKRRIVFIYAVKDEIFGVADKSSNTVKDTIDFSKNRTKFFDFIIPVIPIINSSNSIDKLTEKIDRLPYTDKIDRKFLNDVTIYIDDMRILKNIFNEFIIYRNKLGGIDLDLNRLLAMVIYKNIYPFDFSQLQYNKGLVYDVLQSKSAIVRTRTQTLEKEIEELEAKIKGTEQETLTSLKELQVIYIDALGIFKKVNYNQYHITMGSEAYYGNENINTQSFFDNLKQAVRINYNLPNGSKSQAKSDQIATVFGTKKNYFEREEYITLREENRIELLKEQIARLKLQKAEASSKSLKELIEESDPQDVFSEDIYDKKLLIYLLRHGYIDEMYNHYLTYFHPGSLTEADMKFILSVKNHEPLEANHSLYNIDKIIERLNGNEFKQVEILNYYLLDHLMQNSHCEPYQNYYEDIITQLANETKESIHFIAGFRQTATHKQRFIHSTCRRWSNIWNFIEKESNFPAEEKDSYVSDILAFAEVSDIIKINKRQNLSNFIAHHNDFLTIAPSDKNKGMQILLELDVKFSDLNKLTSDQELFDFIVENELYEINPSTLATILGVTTEQLSYSAIQQSERQDIFNFIDENIETYVQQVLLKVAIKEETEQGIIDLINHKEIPLYLKESIIAEQPVVVTDITKVIHTIWPVLISSKKIKVTWSNVVAYFQEGKSIDADLVNYLNNPEVAGELSKHYIGDAIEFDVDTLEKVSEAIIENQQLTETSFDVLSRSIVNFSSFPVESLSLPKKRVKKMIVQGVLMLSIENFHSLIASYKDLVGLYLEENIKQFIENMNDYPLEHEIMVQLFHSIRVPKKYKIHLIEALDVAALSEEDTAFSEELADFILENRLEVSVEVINWLMAVDMSVGWKLKLISKQIEEFDFATITELLTKLGEPYAEIAENGKRPQIKNNKLHLDLVQTLKDKHYISSYSVNENKIRINNRKNLENS